eukprot:CAMPEP_0181092848 /NCGR_PEP_ID=MMETSP1071-20121207/9131_1 /TAXON_ID=35127 /ORGANISM="Thalassiosira sp., Strain NH16" /LENGTH=292 /DNA_ID=CAMNT_0023175043 /DNA_START=247 /DNA_END=1125 /DNA_ORIENTATION=-
MSPWAVLTMAAGGNLILLLISPPTLGVHALHVPPPPRCNLPPYCTHVSRSMIPPSTSLSTSTLFGSQKRQRRNVTNKLHSTSSSSMPDGGSGNNAMDAEITDSSSAEVATSSSSTSFLRAVDNFGMNLKPWALNAYGRSGKYINDNTNGAVTGGNDKVVANRIKTILCKLQANVLWVLYIIYRGYRGFFVILPGVFREVHRQLSESDLVADPYNGDDDVNADAEQDSTKLRTRITVSVLSMVLTGSYVVTGLLRVLGKFIKTFTSTTSVESSLEAAADEMAENDDKLLNNLK